MTVAATGHSVLVDTSVFVDQLRGHPPASAALSGLLLGDTRVVASVLTRTEILRGLPPRQRAAWKGLADLVVWLPVDSTLADRAGEFAAHYRLSHGSIDLVDYVIAATAERAAAQLWTRNVRHFPMLPGLTEPYS